MSTKDEIITEIKRLFDTEKEIIDTLTLTLALDRDIHGTPNSDATAFDIHQLQLDQLRHISNLVNTIQEVRPSPEDIKFTTDEPLTYQDLLFFSITDESVLNKITKQSKLTRRKLERVNAKEWSEWLDAEKAMLDDYENKQMYGKPIKLPDGAVVMKSLWTYVVKADGRKKARQVCNGSPRFVQGSLFRNKYSGCIEQIGFRLFIALAALNNYIIVGLDATNAFANSPPPSQSTYMEIDTQYKQWYEKKYGVRLADDMVLPILRALQGEPEAGNSWQTTINKELSALNVKPTNHERCLYSVTYAGEKITICRQIDDFAAAVKEDKVADDFFRHIEKKIDMTSQGRLRLYNGIDI